MLSRLTQRLSIFEIIIDSDKATNLANIERRRHRTNWSASFAYFNNVLAWLSRPRDRSGLSFCKRSVSGRHLAREKRAPVCEYLQTFRVHSVSENNVCQRRVNFDDFSVFLFFFFALRLQHFVIYLEKRIFSSFCKKTIYTHALFLHFSFTFHYFEIYLPFFTSSCV